MTLDEIIEADRLAAARRAYFQDLAIRFLREHSDRARLRRQGAEIVERVMGGRS